MRLGSVLAAAAVLLVLLACSVSREQLVLEEFFAASRLRDTTALSRLSIVVLEPREAGAVGRVEVRRVSGMERAPFSWGDRVAELSLQGISDPNAPGLAGEIESEEVTVVAPLRSPDGRQGEATLVVTLGRAVVQGDRKVGGRWIVTAVKGVPGARALPRP